MKYEVTIVEATAYRYTVEADSEEEADSLAVEEHVNNEEPNDNFAYVKDRDVIEIKESY